MRKDSDAMDLYRLLNIEPSANNTSVHKAYRRAALLVHPDKPGGSSEAFQSVARAFEVLSCPVARSVYDRFHFSTSKSQCSDTRCSVKLICRSHARNNVENAAKRLKRQVSRPCGLERQPPKRQAASRNLGPNVPLAQTSTAPSSLDESPLTSHTFQHLRDVLQSMTPLVREVALSDLPPLLRPELASFMKKASRTSGVADTSCTTVQSDNLPASSTRAPPSIPTGMVSGTSHCGERTREQPCRRGRVPLSGFSGVRAVSTRQYKAHMDIKALRLYTRGQCSMEAAIEQHIILVQLRHALQAASVGIPEFWHCTEDIKRVCTSTFTSLGTSEHKLGLCVFVSLRAEEWLGRDFHITSSVMCISEALEVHSRVLRARRVSWEALRAEWVHLMRHKKRSLRTSLSLSEAQALADAARQTALKKRLTHAVCRAMRSLEKEGQQKIKALKSQARHSSSEKRRMRLEAATAALSQRRAMKERRRWLRRSDLTTEDLLRGPPTDLQPV